MFFVVFFFGGGEFHHSTPSRTSESAVRRISIRRNPISFPFRGRYLFVVLRPWIGFLDPCIDPMTSPTTRNQLMAPPAVCFHFPTLFFFIRCRHMIESIGRGS